jgi:hypothetical protein
VQPKRVRGLVIQVGCNMSESKIINKSTRTHNKLDQRLTYDLFTYLSHTYLYTRGIAVYFSNAINTKIDLGSNRKCQNKRGRMVAKNRVEENLKHVTREGYPIDFTK